MCKYALEMLKKQYDKLSLNRRHKKYGRDIDYLLKVFKESKSHAPALTNVNKQSAQQKTPGAIVHPAFLLDETELP